MIRTVSGLILSFSMTDSDDKELSADTVMSVIIAPWNSQLRMTFITESYAVRRTVLGLTRRCHQSLIQVDTVRLSGRLNCSSRSSHSGGWMCFFDPVRYCPSR